MVIMTTFDFQTKLKKYRNTQIAHYWKGCFVLFCFYTVYYEKPFSVSISQSPTLML